MLDIYNVLDAISEIVYVSDAETHEILYINEAGKKILGDCLGETCYKLFHGKSAECTNCPCSNGEGLSEYIRENVMPEKAYMYGLPYSYYEKYKVRRYGFHGTSHSFVSKRAIQMLNLDPDNSKIIVCHLGNGSSISAVKNGKVVDTSMGMTPMEGLVMGTRCGDMDPTIVEYLAHSLNKSLEEVMVILNKKSGVLGISGVSSDFRDLDKASNEGNERAKLAVEVFSYRTAKYIGSYIAAMNGVDAIVFTAGLGENNIVVREQVLNHFGYMGITLDKEANQIRGEEKIISTPDSKVTVAVIPTNEELAIAHETVALLK